MGSFLGGIWNWVSGKDKCPSCGSRNSNRISTSVISRWQEVRTDRSALKREDWYQVVLNCRSLQAQSQCNECRKIWNFQYQDAERA
jgi:hypothetical protein